MLIILGATKLQLAGVAVGVGVGLAGGVQQEQLLVFPSNVQIGGTSH
jgi:hypothetical protein